MPEINGFIPMWQRFGPADDFELQLLAALVHWPEARRRFLHLNIPPSIFENKNCRIVAGYALKGCLKPTPAAVAEALAAETESTYSIAYGLLMFRQSCAAHAVADVERYAAKFACRWLGPTLRWAGDKVDAAAPDLPEVIAELDKIIGLFRAGKGVA